MRMPKHAVKHVLAGMLFGFVALTICHRYGYDACYTFVLGGIMGWLVAYITIE